MSVWLWCIGSSPRMWGTQNRERVFIVGHRFIPTHVGNTASSNVKKPVPTVHPHACGEHRYPFRLFYYLFGSSPRMWGTHYLKKIVITSYRFIPTHVGNTRWIPEPFGLNCGSSPRMWGTPLTQCAGQTVKRFIPTHVGNTCTYKVV